MSDKKAREEMPSANSSSVISVERFAQLGSSPDVAKTQTTFFTNAGTTTVA